MRIQLEKTALKAIRDARMMSPGERVGVAVSGGADSVALLRLLERVQSHLGITLAVVHLNHLLRGAESEADAQFVRNLAGSRNLDFLSQRENVLEIAKQNRWNLEDAARRVRYGFFRRLIDEGTVARIAVAHTADDQAETVLARILRGTGPSGLAGIYPVAGKIVRPLLGIRRQELRGFLKSIDQPWREDTTNSDLHRQRSRIRQKLLPVLESEFSPSAVNRLASLARLAREEQDFWDAIVGSCYRTLARPDGKEISISISDLISPLKIPGDPEAPKPIVREQSHLRVLTGRLIRRLYREARGDQLDLGTTHVRQVIRLATESTSGRQIELPGNIIVRRSFGELHFSTRCITGDPRETGARHLAYHYLVHLAPSGTTAVSVPELGRRFHLKVIDWPGAERETGSAATALDADLIQRPVFLRNWRPGDAYRPFGHRRSKKLKTMFLEAKVPTRDRASWPIIESRGRIVWARNMPLAFDFCATGKTRAGVLVEEERI